MTTRVQLNSKTHTIDVYKQMPSTQENKRYSIKVERLTLPPMSGGLILNQPLFTVERRLTVDTEYSDIDQIDETETIADEVVLHEPATFTPVNVRTAAEFVFQLNSFFRKTLLSLVTSDDDFEAGLVGDVYPVPEIFQPADFELTDWYEYMLTEEGDPVKTALEAVYRNDGRIGIKFSSEAVPMFVLRLTDEGQRIFGWTKRHLAVGPNNTFEGEYTTSIIGGLPVVNDHYDVTLAIPATPVDIIGTFDNNIFSHGQYRHEVVLLTTLPVPNYLECDQRHAAYKNQLASYKYPNEPIKTEYDGVLYRVLKNERKNKYLFEQSTRTHNEFLLTSTTLQNFHIRLMQRNYSWDELKNKFVMTEEPYQLSPESFWTIQLAVKPLRD